MGREQPSHDSDGGFEHTDGDVSVEGDGPNHLLNGHVKAWGEGKGGREGRSGREKGELV